MFTYFNYSVELPEEKMVSYTFCASLSLRINPNTKQVFVFCEVFVESNDLKIHTPIVSTS